MKSNKNCFHVLWKRESWFSDCSMASSGNSKWKRAERLLSFFSPLFFWWICFIWVSFLLKRVSEHTVDLVSDGASSQSSSILTMSPASTRRKHVKAQDPLEFLIIMVSSWNKHVLIVCCFQAILSLKKSLIDYWILKTILRKVKMFEAEIANLSNRGWPGCISYGLTAENEGQRFSAMKLSCSDSANIGQEILESLNLLTLQWLREY